MENLCFCGKEHKSSVKEVIVGKGVVNKLPEVTEKLKIKKPFIITDSNINNAYGDIVRDVLKGNNIPFGEYVFEGKNLEPDELSVGSAVMHYDTSCDGVLAVGSGVINDIAKILSNLKGCPYVIVASAPSMDGYASATSSVAMDGVKVSLNSKSPDIIIGDTDFLKNAPIKMLKSGLGDMIAKYVSICEWRISNIITGEYYCEAIADLIRNSLKKCIDNADKLLQRDEQAVETVFEALVQAGLAMSYAGISRPASGIEHYFSHVWDMRGLEFGSATDFHGIQCSIGTVYALKLYEYIREVKPNREKAMNYVSAFEFDKWSDDLRAFIGKGADTMILMESKDKKYDIANHLSRYNVIEEKWNDILCVIKEELPESKEIVSLLKSLDMPTTCEELGIKKEDLFMTFKATKDIRYKYVLSHLAWDLGILDELEEFIK